MCREEKRTPWRACHLSGGKFRQHCITGAATVRNSRLNPPDHIQSLSGARQGPWNVRGNDLITIDFRIFVCLAKKSEDECGSDRTKGNPAREA